MICYGLPDSSPVRAVRRAGTGPAGITPNPVGRGTYSWEAGFPGEPRRCFLGNRSSWTCFSRLCSTCVYI